MPRRRRAPPALIGPSLRALREGAGFTIEQVADAMGTSKSRVSCVERDATKATWAWIVRFADACGFDADPAFTRRKS